MLPDYILRIMDVLSASGFKAYAVGGCVRDLLARREPHDWDVATDALCAEVVRLFPKTAPTGVKYGTVTVFCGGGKAEVTTFRSDGEYRDGRRPESVGFIGDLTADLSRRDFTMNALAMSRFGSITDPFGGAEDIEKGRIRCVGEPEARFSEDALRMLRAIRFSAQLGFEIEPRTLEGIKKRAGLCAALSPERIRDELKKILLSERPEMLAEAVSLGLLDAFLTRVEPEGASLRRIALLPDDAGCRFSALAAVLKRCGAVPDAEIFLKSLRLDGKTSRLGGAAADAALSGFPEARADIKRLLARLGPLAARFAARDALALGDGGAEARLADVLESGECFTLKRLAVTGRDLTAAGVPSGPELGSALELLLERVIERPEDNRRDILLNLITKREAECTGLER